MPRKVKKSPGKGAINSESDFKEPFLPSDQSKMDMCDGNATVLTQKNKLPVTQQNIAKADVTIQGPEAVVAASSESEQDCSAPQIPILPRTTLTKEALNDLILTRRLLVEGAEGETRKFHNLGNRLQNFIKICGDDKVKIETVEARYREVLGLVHQIKQMGRKEVNSIKALKRDTELRKMVSDDVMTKIEDTKRVISETKVKLREIEVKRSEALREMIMYRALVQTADRESASARVKALEAEIKSLVARKEKLLKFLGARTFFLDPLLVLRQRISEVMAVPYSESDSDDHQPTEPEVDFNPRIPSVDETNTAAQWPSKSPFAPRCSSNGNSPANNVADDMMNEILFMDFEADTNNLPASTNQSSEIAASASTKSDENNYSTLTMYAMDDSQNSNNDKDKIFLPAWSRQLEEDALISTDTDNEHEVPGTNAKDLSSSTISSSVYIVEEELLMSSEDEVVSTDNTDLQNPESTDGSQLTLHAGRGFKNYVYSASGLDSPLFPSSPKRVKPDPEPETEVQRSSSSDEFQSLEDKETIPDDVDMDIILEELEVQQSAPSVSVNQNASKTSNSNIKQQKAESEAGASAVAGPSSVVRSDNSSAERSGSSSETWKDAVEDIISSDDDFNAAGGSRQGGLNLSETSSSSSDSTNGSRSRSDSDNSDR